MSESSPRKARTRKARTLTDIVTAVGAIAISTVVYYILPTGLFDITVAGAVAIFALGLLVVAAAIMLQTWRFWSATASLATVVAAFYLSVLFFAAVYFGLSYYQPGSIHSLYTKTDALYFSLSITSTVGFGDVHASSQAGRAVVAMHMVFNIGFLSVAIAVVRAAATRRAA